MPPPTPWRYRHSTEPRSAPSRRRGRQSRATCAQHLGYFLGYANWNYFTTPFLFEYPGVTAVEIEPWHEAGQTTTSPKFWAAPSSATTEAGIAASADCALPLADGSSDATRTTPSI